jgi:hypothetical protein
LNLGTTLSCVKFPKVRKKLHYMLVVLHFIFAIPQKYTHQCNRLRGPQKSNFLESLQVCQL